MGLTLPGWDPVQHVRPVRSGCTVLAATALHPWGVSSAHSVEVWCRVCDKPGEYVEWQGSCEPLAWHEGPICSHVTWGMTSVTVSWDVSVVAKASMLTWFTWRRNASARVACVAGRGSIRYIAEVLFGAVGTYTREGVAAVVVIVDLPVLSAVFASCQACKVVASQITTAVLSWVPGMELGARAQFPPAPGPLSLFLSTLAMTSAETSDGGEVGPRRADSFPVSAAAPAWRDGSKGPRLLFSTLFTPRLGRACLAPHSLFAALVWGGEEGTTVLLDQWLSTLLDQGPLGKCQL